MTDNMRSIRRLPMWWGYRHTNGTIQPKRWFGDPRDIQEAHESPFCGAVSQPFEATDRNDAILKLEERL